MLKTITAMTLIWVGMGAWAPAQSVINMRMNQSFSSIQAGVDAAAPGDTLRISSGSYNEAVFINKSLTLEALEADGDAPAITPDPGRVGLTVRGAAVRLSGFDVVVENANALYAESADLTLDGIGLWGNERADALSGYAWGSVSIQDSVVFGFRNGLSAERLPRLTVDGSYFGNVRQGLVIHDPQTPPSITNTSFVNEDDRSRFRDSVAVQVARGRDPVVRSILVQHYHLGVWFHQTQGGKVLDSRFDDDMETDGDAVFFTNCTGDPVAKTLLVRGCKFTEYDYGFDTVYTEGAVIEQNHFESAELAAINSNFSADRSERWWIHADDNWWGSSDGPGGAFGRRGLPVGSGVYIQRWLTEPPPFEGPELDPEI